MEVFWGCVAALVILAPLVLLIISLVEIHRLKSAVRNLVQRVANLESGTAHDIPAEKEPVLSRAPLPRTSTAPSAPTISRETPVSTPIAEPPPIPPQPQPRPAAPEPPPPPRIMPPPPPSKPFDWEAFFGVKLFAWIGGFVLFLGIVFLVKYSFENNLITPAMRGVVGTVLRLGLIVTGRVTAARNFLVSRASLCLH